MKVVVQRVSEAAVSVDGSEVGSIGPGLLLLVGIAEGDRRQDVEQMCRKICSMRIFSDEEGKMNHDLEAVNGEVLLVPNFTLCADTDTGNRPGFGPAASPDRAEELFDTLVETFRERVDGNVESGEFGTKMDVRLTNVGPVTFVL